MDEIEYLDTKIPKIFQIMEKHPNRKFSINQFCPIWEQHKLYEKNKINFKLHESYNQLVLVNKKQLLALINMEIKLNNLTAEKKQSMFLYLIANYANDRLKEKYTKVYKTKKIYWYIVDLNNIKNFVIAKNHYVNDELKLRLNDKK